MWILTVLSALSLLGTAHAGEFSFLVPFAKKVPRRSSKRRALAALRGKPATTVLTEKALSAGGASTITVNGSDSDYEYLTNVTIGGQHFSLNVDTGSSDTWVPQKGFECFDLEGNSVPPATCAFGTAGFDTAIEDVTKSNHLVELGQQHFDHGTSSVTKVSSGRDTGQPVYQYG
ncbi:hypothetical protein DFH07DRAFT_769962 [Mycena maculata]|uniref:Peptidase A1 domain-containing protein n=1 Tax=Mycena maculata TaxID=230809 RepID=A0AAD7JJZ5_9AGAR|nr:hypothetical protein DFH07DRAFT_775173 [Mycena maculata]KAJ7754404.1 hypothetical protein DFH07DRAFT_773794 [Mycena maculata]KAJ7766424.1 hypothetical protein DFH07DRAFT_769962 [Mycena maculata]